MSLTNQRDRPRIADELQIEQLHVEIEDNPFEDLLMSLDGLCAWIDSALHFRGNTSEDANRVSDASANKSAMSEESSGPAVLVHCIQGVSRSGAIIVAYLMRTKSIDYESALALAQKSRSIITPNSGFADQLRIWQQMHYTIYLDYIDCVRGDEGRKTKPEYEQWKADRGILLSRSEEAKQQVMRKSMANMAAAFGKRRMELREAEGGV
jgi:hypothetical protein